MPKVTSAQCDFETTFYQLSNYNRDEFLFKFPRYDGEETDRYSHTQNKIFQVRLNSCL